MEEFQKLVSENLQGTKVTDIIFVNCETPIFALLPNSVLIASQGAIKDMLTDKNLLVTLCGYESATQQFKAQFKQISAMDNFNLLRANISKQLGMEPGSGVTQGIKNLLFSSFSTLELLEAVSIGCINLAN